MGMYQSEKNGYENYSEGETLIGSFCGKPLYRRVICITPTYIKYTGNNASGINWTNIDVSGLGNWIYTKIDAILKSEIGNYAWCTASEAGFIVLLGSGSTPNSVAITQAIAGGDTSVKCYALIFEYIKEENL